MSALTEDIGFQITTPVAVQRGMTDVEAERFLQTGVVPDLSQPPAADDEQVLSEREARASLNSHVTITAGGFLSAVGHHSDEHHSE
jgi:hypothetical protein